MHRDTCIHTQTHVCTYTEIHTHRHTYIHTDTCTYTYMYIRTDTCTIVHAYTDTHTCTRTYMHLIKSCSTSLFTHRSGYCTLGEGKEHCRHSLLCFHCAQLLSSPTAPSANDRSGLSSEPAHKMALGDTLAPTIISTRIGEQASGNFKPCS
ncbi:unnamed protein product, partial [Staurois parvus]